jgi:molybdate transport system substrate-binding protein
MVMQAILRRAAFIGFAASFLLAGAAPAAELHVVSSGGGLAALKALAGEFERQTGHKLLVDFAPSMGTTPGAVPQRLARGEDLDCVLMVGYALDKLVAEGKVTDPVDVFISKIGVVVKQGAPTPDISSVEGLRQAMLAARTIAVSDSASGVYIQREMLRKLGIEDQVRSKIKVVQADPVGETVAKGDADLGFQQISELKPMHGIVLLGPIPEAVQEATLYKAGVVATSHNKEADRELERFLTSPAAAAVLEQSGLEPTSTRH